MARTTTFDPDRIAARAGEVFWERGFEGASLSELEAATGLHRSSIYNTFHSKRGLFDAAAHHYMRTVVEPSLAPLHTATDGPAALGAYLDRVATRIAAVDEDAPQGGCLLLSTAAGAGGLDAPMRELVARYWRALEGAHMVALGRRPDADAPATQGVARALTALVMAALGLARIDRTLALDYLDAARRQLADWTRPAPSHG